MAADLAASYAACRRVAAAHGRTYYLATLLLPAAKRPAVHALYAFARRADDIVDDLSPAVDPAERAAALRDWGDRFLGGAADGDVLPAVHDTVRRYGIRMELFEAFLASMRMDLTTCRYETWDDLTAYMYGSAAVIGLQMLPVLGTVPGCARVAEPYARDLGLAFQLTNFVRDVGEDIRRGRVYLPQEDLRAFGVTVEQLAAGVVDGPVRALLAFEVERARRLYRDAAPGIRLLDPTSRDCVATALRLYEGILDEVQRAGYRVLDRRVRVGRARRAGVALPALVRAVSARRASTRPASA